MEFDVNLEDLKNIYKIKSLVESDSGFKRYVYNITEEDQNKYGFQFIGEYENEPDYRDYSLNTTYRNKRTKTVYIRTKNAWSLFVKDGINGCSGGGLGYNDVMNLINTALQGYSPSGTTSGGTYYGLNGVIQLDTINDTYTVTHVSVDCSKISPILTLNIPNLDSSMFMVNALNIKDTSFDVMLSQVPQTSGYSISWFLPITNYDILVETLKESISESLTLPSSSITISNSFTSLSGSTLDQVLSSTDENITKASALKNYIQVNLEDLSGSPEVIYSGQTTADGKWYIKKILILEDSSTIIKHSNVSNNPTHVTYGDAWNNRSSLIYSNLEDLIFT